MLSDATPPAGTLRLSLTGSGLALLWLAAVLAGFAVMVDADMTPGEKGVSPIIRPIGLVSPRAADRPLLLVFAHPRCPCTMATLTELNHILTDCPGTADVRIFLMTPSEAANEWLTSPLWDEAKALPDTTVVADPKGAMATRFDVRTSGHVLLYAADGRLLFSGGITSARGEVGDSFGKQSIVALLQGKRGVKPEAEVFGCPLFNSSVTSAGGKESSAP